MPGVVVAFRGDEPPGVTLEAAQGASFRPQMIDDLHGTEVVDSRIEAQFVDNGNAGIVRGSIQGCDVR